MKKIMLVLSTLIVMLVINGLIIEKEQTLRHGDTILVKMGAVDPRSMMQGDYMAVGYKLVMRLSEKSYPMITQGAQYIVIEVDKDRVAQFSRVYQNEALNDHEYLVGFTIDRTEYNFLDEDDKRIYLQLDLPQQYFIQEGSQAYDDAVYVVLKTSKSGEYLLFGLADEEKQLIKG
ncbi:MAG: GDYXXLXY domain-containing protein [Candidatus Comchoanobacterales bacterium]